MYTTAQKMAQLSEIASNGNENPFFIPRFQSLGLMIYYIIFNHDGVFKFSSSFSSLSLLFFSDTKTDK